MPRAAGEAHFTYAHLSVKGSGVSDLSGKHHGTSGKALLDVAPCAVRDALLPIRNPFAVALMSPGNAFAIGSIIRVAHSFLAREIVVVGADDWYAKGDMGMAKYEEVVRLPDASAFLRRFEHKPVWVVEKDHAKIAVQAVSSFPEEVVFVFGSERFGVPDVILERADQVVGVPIYGVNHSLPVTVAAGIVMHEWARRWYREGTVR